MLLGHVLEKTREWLVIHSKESIAPEDRDRYLALVANRAGGVPVQYLTGKQEFWSLEFEVNENVLIPRPETEIVVEEALARLPTLPAIAIDIGTGSGNIAIALAKERPGLEVFAVDHSDRALEVARRNARRHGVLERMQLHHGDRFEPLAGLGIEGRIDAVVSNPPYVSAAEFPELMVEVRDHEPREALVSGPTGTEFYPGLIEAATRFLKPGGVLVMELGADRSAAVRRMLASAGAFGDCRVVPDGAGIDRVTISTRTGGS